MASFISNTPLDIVCLLFINSLDIYLLNTYIRLIDILRVELIKYCIGILHYNNNNKMGGQKKKKKKKCVWSVEGI
jgi:hypothetical protein